MVELDQKIEWDMALDGTKSIGDRIYAIVRATTETAAGKLKKKTLLAKAQAVDRLGGSKVNSLDSEKRAKYLEALGGMDVSKAEAFTDRLILLRVSESSYDSTTCDAISRHPSMVPSPPTFSR